MKNPSTSTAKIIKAAAAGVVCTALLASTVLSSVGFFSSNNKLKQLEGTVD